jgi:hypothetical protein
MRFNNAYSPTITVSDDQSNVYNIGSVTVDSANHNDLAIYYALNVAAGTRKIQVLLSSANPSDNFAVEASEFYNVSTLNALDGNGGNSATSVSIAAGNIAPTTSGDLIYQIAAQGTVAPVTYTAGSQANVNWSLLSVDLQEPFAVQYGVYNSTAAINPTMTQSSGVNFETSAILLKPATSGSAAPPGITVNRIEHNSLWSSVTNGSGPGYPNPSTMQFPSSGPLLVAAVATGNFGSVTGITDNNNNTWLPCGPGIVASVHSANIFYAANATTGSSETLTITSTSNTVDSTVVLYDISGASSSPCDTSASANGIQTSPVAALTGPTVTPTAPDGLIIGEVQQLYGTVTSISGTNMLLDSSSYSQENLDGPENVDQNGGWAHFYNPTTSPVPFIWGYRLDSANVAEQYWASYAVAFK